MALEASRQKALAMATEIRIIRLNETHEEHLYVMPEHLCDTSFWTYVFYVLVFLVIAFVLSGFAILVYLTQHERTKEQRLRALEERYKVCNRFCPECDAAMYEEGMRPTSEVYVNSDANALSEEQEAVTRQHYSDEDPEGPQYYSDGNPAADEWPETDLLNPD